MENSRKKIEQFILEKETTDENKKMFQTIFQQIAQKNQGVVFLLTEFHNQLRLGDLKTSFVGSLYIESQLKLINIKKKEKDLQNIDEFGELYSIYLSIVDILLFYVEDSEKQQMPDNNDLLSILAFFEKNQRELKTEAKEMYNAMCTLIILFRHLMV